MESRLGEGNMLLGGKHLHTRCCTHILNLIVQDGLEVIKKSIARIREGIAYWIATPKRYDKFVKVAQQQKVELKKKLCLDCKTRWNSTFVMLSTAIPYRKVFDRLGTLDQHFVCPLNDDWKFAAIVCEKLEWFYQLTKLFYGTKYVIANIFFPKICEIRLKINSWKEDENEII